VTKSAQISVSHGESNGEEDFMNSEPTESDRLKLFESEDPKTKLAALRIVTQPQRIKAWARLLGVIFSAGALAGILALFRALKIIP
jgi:hypothetical protein